jgi:subtilisin-like proprotein convertase family protein
MNLINDTLKVVVFFTTTFFFLSRSANAQKFYGQGGVIHDYAEEYNRDVFPIEVKGIKNNIDSSFGLIGVCINIRHTKVSDLKIQLMAPDGTTIWLSNRNGGDQGEDYQNTCFSNNAFTGYIAEGNAPFIGEYIPDSRMEFVNNGQNPNDYWYLLIDDLHQRNTGVLNSFSIEFGTNPPTTAKSSCAAGNIEVCKTTKGFTNNILLPDLVLIPSFTHNQIKEYAFNDATYPGQLRVAASIANIGEGPMEIQGSNSWLCGNQQVDSTNRCNNGQLPRQKIWQNLYYKQEDKLIKKKVVAGTLYFDEKPGHQHYHVDDWIEMRIVKKTKNKKGLRQTVVGKSSKVSYCLFDTGICRNNDSLCVINNKLYGPHNLSNYGLGYFTDCHSKLQGISVGGYDTYGLLYEGQDIKLPKGLPKGWYYLQIIIDPKNRYQESNKKNNIFEKKIWLSLQ